MIRINCPFRRPFWAFTQYRWPFLGFPLNCCICMTFFGHSTQVPWFESAHDSNSISKTWIDSTSDSSGFPGIDSEPTRLKPQVLIKVDWWLKVLLHFSIQIHSWLERKAFDSEPTHDSTLSQPMSASSSLDPCLNYISCSRRPPPLAMQASWERLQWPLPAWPVTEPSSVFRGRYSWRWPDSRITFCQLCSCYPSSSRQSMHEAYARAEFTQRRI